MMRIITVSKKVKCAAPSKILKVLSVLSVLLIIVACGSSGDDGIIGTGITYGAASTGEPIANQDVDIKSSSGENFTTQTNAQGAYEISGTPANEAFLIRIAKDDGTFLYSIGHSKGEERLLRNIHPYTDLIVRNWFSVNGLNIDEEFSQNDSISDMPSEEEISDVENEYKQVLSSALNEYGASADFNLLSTQFDTEESAFTTFLQNSEVVLTDTNVSVSFTDEETGIENYAIDSIALNTDYTANTNTNPEVPNKVRAVGVDEGSIQVAWASSQDDKGVKSYKVYRDEELIGTTPFSLYQDDGLDASLSYSYEVQAEDGDEAESERSIATSRVTPVQDGTVPAAPFNLSAESLFLQLTLNWEHPNLDDILYFKVYDTSILGNDNVLVVTTDTRYTTIRVGQGCFTVVAFRAENNQSLPSNEVCTEAGTSGLTYLSIPATLAVGQGENSVLSVARTGNLSGAISVEYTFTDVTAVIGTDYQPDDGLATGTLTWEDGDGEAKDIMFTTLFANDVSVAPKFFFIELTNPMYIGNSSAIPPVIQSSSIFTVRIIEAE